MRKFFFDGIKLYTKNFALYNAHHIVHIPDDYERFEVPLTSLSSFRYENANGHVKRLITGHFQPLTQLQNKVSSLVYTKLYGRSENNKVINSVEEYYEIPQLCQPINDNNEEHVEWEVGRSLPYVSGRFQRFHEMRFRNFTLRTDNKRDCHVFMSGSTEDYYVRLTKILKDMDTDEIYFVGQKFQRKRPLFSLAGQGFPEMTSRTAGIVVVDQLSHSLSTFSFTELNEKCFATPLNLVGTSNEWVFQRYLH